METLSRGGAAVAAGLLGAIIGSFLGAVLLRLPQGRSIVTGRSTCESCGRTLAPLELVPIVSFLALRGRCRGCGTAIDRWQFAAELGGAAVGVAAALTTPDLIALSLAVTFGWQLLLLGLLDLRHLWLPDRLVLLLLVSSLIPAALAVSDAGPPLPGGALGPLIGAALGFGMLWAAAALYRRWRGIDGLGAGDPKLLGAIGLWVGPVGVVATLLGGAIVGLLAAGGLAVAGRAPTARTALPLGSCLALAAFAVYLAQNTIWG